MIIKNAMIHGELRDIACRDGKFVPIEKAKGEEVIDAKGQRVIPGLIDIHTHGCCGYDALDADFEKMCQFYAERGTTAWYPTVSADSAENLKKVTEAETHYSGAQILGFHFEGPYLCKEYKGGMVEEYLRNPSIEEFEQFDNVKMITIAPELPGALEFIKHVSQKCIMSLGHTACSYETALEAIENGANCLTHTFNAMTPLSHRNPGVIGAGIEKQIYAQFICDGFHVAKPIILAGYRIFGPEKMILISDSVRCAQLPDGDYDQQGRMIFLRNGEIRLADGTICGSYVSLWDCVKKAVEFGIPFDDAVTMATRTPAELMNVKKGRIEYGWDADMLIIDDEMNIETVIIGGELF